VEEEKHFEGRKTDLYTHQEDVMTHIDIRLHVCISMNSKSQIEIHVILADQLNSNEHTISHIHSI
jgi:hypothetical protein